MPAILTMFVVANGQLCASRRWVVGKEAWRGEDRWTYKTVVERHGFGIALLESFRLVIG